MAKKNQDIVVTDEKLTEMVEESTEKGITLKKVIEKEEQKISFWNRAKFRKEIEDGMYREIKAIRATLRDVPPDTEAYSRAMNNLKIWTDAYTSLTRNKTDLWKTGLTVAASIAGTLLVCGHESRGEAFVGKGLSTILKPKDKS
jgi:hypothetical protein